MEELVATQLDTIIAGLAPTKSNCCRFRLSGLNRQASATVKMDSDRCKKMGGTPVADSNCD